MEPRRVSGPAARSPGGRGGGRRAAPAGTAAVTPGVTPKWKKGLF